MAHRALLLSPPDGVPPAAWLERYRGPAFAAGRPASTGRAAIAPVPRFDDLEEERPPRYRRWLVASIGGHALLLAGCLLIAVVPGIAPPRPADPAGMIVTLADRLPTYVPRPATNMDAHADADGGAPSPVRAVPTIGPATVAVGRAAPAAIDARSSAPPIPPISAAASSAPVATDGQPMAPSIATESRVSPTIPTVMASRSPAEIAWERAILDRLKRRKLYPAAALEAGASGAVLLRLVIDRDGRLLAAELATSGGAAALDQSALTMAARASPFPPPPASMTGDVLRVLVPIEFVALHR